MDLDPKHYLHTFYGVDGSISPGRFEVELARRIGAPKRRRPMVRAWRRYLQQPGREGVEGFYREVLARPREKLEALIYSLHLPFFEFYARTVPPLLPSSGRVLEVGAFTGGMVNYMARACGALEWVALEPLPEALELGKRHSGASGVEVEWHLGWFEPSLDIAPVNTVLLLSVLPEGHLEANLSPELGEDGFLGQFPLDRQLQALSGLLEPGGRLIYGHGPFLGRNPGAVVNLMNLLGFGQTERLGEGDYVLVTGVMPEKLRRREPAVKTAASPPDKVAMPTLTPAELEALLDHGEYTELLSYTTPEAGGLLAALRGRALFALGRYKEAVIPLSRANQAYTEQLRLLALVECGQYAEALPGLERLRTQGGAYALALGRAYLESNRLEDALRTLYWADRPEAQPYLGKALDRVSARAFQFLREKQFAEVSRRVEFVEDLSPGLLRRDLLYLGLQAVLEQGLWARAERYARRMFDLGEPAGAIGLAFSRLKVHTPEGLEELKLEDLRKAEPYLTDAVARSEEPLALLALGLLRFREGRHAEAIYYLRRVAREGRGEVAGSGYHYLALALRAEGEPALSVLGEHKRAHTFRPYPTVVLYQMARESLGLGEQALAREFLSYVREAGLGGLPSSETLHLVQMIEALEGPWEAFLVLSEALEHTPHPDLGTLELAFQLSRAFRGGEEAEQVRVEYVAALYQHGRLSRVEEILRQELASQPDALEVHFDLAEHLERTGRYPEAAKAWKKALEVAYFRDKDLGLAREVLRNLIFLNPADSDIDLYIEELNNSAAKLVRLRGESEVVAAFSRERLAEEGLPHFHSEYVLVVGGHTHLRSRMVPFLTSHGLRIDWFDSDTTSVGRETLKRIQSRVGRANGVMVISSYVGHNLSEPIRHEAEACGVPVFITLGRARGITGFLRALEDFAPQVFRHAIQRASNG